MSCTTLLVGKNASYDGSTIIARNDDSGADGFTPKKFVVISSKEQKRKYKTVISHLEIDLPDNPMSYTAMPNAVKGKGIWAASGINEEVEASNAVTSALNKLFALAEAYPELKANENFMSLQADLKETEDKISYARGFYNDTVLTYNNLREQFPSNIIASMFKFEKYEFFNADEKARENPQVKF